MHDSIVVSKLYLVKYGRWHWGLCKVMSSVSIWQDQMEEGSNFWQVLLIAECPWDSILVVFISRFLRMDGKTSIMFMIGKYSKYGIFIVTPILCSSKIVAGLFYKHIMNNFWYFEWSWCYIYCLVLDYFVQNDGY